MVSDLEKFTKDNVMTYVGGNILVGEYKAHTMQESYLVEERIKVLVRSMVKDLQCYHNKGYCVSKFNHHNFEITNSGRARLIGVTVEEKNDSLIGENYANLCQVITKTIFRRFSLQHVPSDWRSLLGLTRTRALENEYLICNHSALMPIENRFLFFFRAFEHLKFSLGRSDSNKQQAIYAELPYAKCWPEIIQRNLLLETSFSHKSHDISGKPEGFFDFYRHTNCHRMDRCFLIPEIGGYTANDFENILIVRYPLYLGRLEEALHKHGQLQCLAPHTLF